MECIFFFVFSVPDEPWEWVTLEWLTKWLAEPAKIDQISNKVPKCPHDKLPPDDVVKMKCISKEGVRQHNF